MTEITIHGRGGQGGVTLAKLIASAFFRRGLHTQAFGVYAAERSGAPVQSFVRIGETEITNHNQVQAPDHVIVLDPTLVGQGLLAGAKAGGWVVLNTREPLESLGEPLAGRRVAAIDATGLAVENGLGTQAVPIVNTTMFGAVGRLLELSLEDVVHTLNENHLGGGNVEAARRAYAEVQETTFPGSAVPTPPAAPKTPIASILDEDVGGSPRIKTGAWATRRPLRRQLTPPCNHICPAGNDVQGFLAAMSRGDNDAALEILLRTTPLPGVCGRVCPAPCMDTCNRGLFDEAINVKELERYAADHGRRSPASKPYREESIAVIGSGPAGLSAAYALAKLGYPVTIYEAGRELGGLLRTGIPPYRLPREVLDTEISFILLHGIDSRRHEFIDRNGLLWLSRRHAAVLIATGQQDLRAVQFEGDDEHIVMQGIEFLERARCNRVSMDGMRVAVVGGGNTAVDAARSARRLGAKSVHILYRRTREEMPAIAEEVDEALEEGIVLDELSAPLRVRHDALGTLVTCRRMRLGEPDESGRRRPVPETTEDSQFDVRCDRVILALGQAADLSVLPAGSEIREGQVTLGMTASPIYVCGDFATNEGTVAAAIGSGRRAAMAIHGKLTGEEPTETEASVVATPEFVRKYLFTKVPREHGEALPPAQRRHSFEEVRKGITHVAGDDIAIREARRCFSCGVCNFCDRCVVHCPEGIMVRERDGYRFDESFCKGCGICMEECPRGVIAMSAAPSGNGSGT